MAAGLRVVHISDLHFCLEPLASKLARLSGLFAKELNVRLDIEVCNPGKADALTSRIQSIDPDALIVSGDITTFGDAASFARAADWIKPLVARAGGHNRRVIVVPGNHDVLGVQLRMLLRKIDEKVPWYARWPLKIRLSAVIDSITECLKAAQVSDDEKLDPFAEFRTFAESLDALSAKPTELPIDDDGASAVLVAPFNSVSTDPIWMNLGEHRCQEELRLSDAFATGAAGRGLMRIAVLHHAPVSSPNVAEGKYVNAYNSMPGGTQFLKRLQAKGVDVILHGHQHEEGALLFDYDLESAGHAYCVGAPSATATDSVGFNLLQIENVNQLKLTPFRFDGAEFAPVHSQALDLCLERNRPPDKATQIVRLEVKRYLPGIAEDAEIPLWDEIYEQGSVAELVYISGRHLRQLKDGRHKDLTKLLAKTKVRILLSDPTSLRAIAASASAGGDIWGTKETLERLASSAGEVCEWLCATYIDNLSIGQRRNIDVRQTQTLLPFAATVAHANMPWGKMVVRLLPVGAVGDLPNPVLKLNRRSNDTLFDYYLQHLRRLLAKGTRIGGDWCHGEADLSD